MYVFLALDAPEYIAGYSVCVAFICLSALSSCAYCATVVLENRARARNASNRGDSLGVSTPEEKARMGDLNPDYRYLS